ncbi:hypothetical protein ACJMK2_033005 [Sinanodonta woodiana]|uniref:F-box domain-containing protein n=1 Tax=Sinanodonta woodiana TaxID=1069815 RepID=A0ABD3X3H9_SINWO
MECNDSLEDIYDFSILPNVTWVKIMSFLRLEDRYSLSVTCRTLYNVFNHPSLWHTLVIQMAGSPDNYSREPSVSVQRKYFHLAKQFGRYFQNLSIKIQGHLNKFPEEWVGILKELGMQCRLESLTLLVGPLTSAFHNQEGYKPEEQDLKALMSFVEHAFRMKKIHIRSWPMYPTIQRDENQNVFLALMKNPRLKDLECLTMFWAKETEWSERKPILFTPDFVLTVIKHFRSLNHFALRSPMLSGEIIEELGSRDRVKLQLLQIYVNYVNISHNPNYQVPEISSSSWSRLVASSPDLRVQCTVFSRVPDVELGNILKSEVPLEALHFSQYSRCSAQMLITISDMYHRTLTRFVCLCNSNQVDWELVNLVYRCEHLNHFVYHGTLKVTTVETLARCRGTAWRTFEIMGINVVIDTEEPTPEDQVIAQRQNGEYYLVGLLRHHQDEQQIDERRTVMIQAVSDCLGYKWCPV